MPTTKTTTTTKAAPRKRAARKAAPVPEPVEEETPKAKPGRKLTPEAKAAREAKLAEEAEAKQAAQAARQADEDGKIDEITTLRDGGAKWDEISEATGINVSTCQYLYLKGSHRNGKRPEATPEAIVAEREAGNSYAKIQAKYGIGRSKVWQLMEEAGVDHFQSDIGKGGRFIQRDPEKVAARQAKKATGTKRARKAAFKGFTDEVEDADVLTTVNGKSIEWNKTRGEGTLTANVKPDSVKIVVSGKDGARGLQFHDGSKVRTIPVNNIVAVS